MGPASPKAKARRPSARGHTAQLSACSVAAGEIGSFDLVELVHQLVGSSVQRDATALEQVHPVRDLERLPHMLLDEEHADPAFVASLTNRGEETRDDHRR